MTYRLTCDRCNRREYSEGDEDEADMLLFAHQKGWRRRQVPNGSLWDLCPRCIEIEDSESPCLTLKLSRTYDRE